MGDSRRDSHAPIAIELLRDLISKFDSDFAAVHEFVNACLDGEHSDLSRLEAIDAEFSVQLLCDRIALARGYFEQVGIGPHANELHREAEKLRKDVNDYGAALVALADAVKSGAATEAAVLQKSGELHDKAILLQLDILSVEATLGTVKGLFARIVRTFEAAEALESNTAGGISQCDEVSSSGADAGQAVSVEQATLRLLSVFTGGVADERFHRAAGILNDENLNTNEKLSKINAVVPFPPTASAQQLADMIGVSKTAVINSKWWDQNRKGEKVDEIGRRQVRHKERARQHEPSPLTDDDE